MDQRKKKHANMKKYTVAFIVVIRKRWREWRYDILWYVVVFLVQSLIQFSVQDEMRIMLHHFFSAQWNGSMRKSSLNELYKREKKMARKKQIDCLYVILMIHYYKIEAKKIKKKTCNLTSSSSWRGGGGGTVSGFLGFGRTKAMFLTYAFH